MEPTREAARILVPFCGIGFARHHCRHAEGAGVAGRCTLARRDTAEASLAALEHRSALGMKCLDAFAKIVAAAQAAVALAFQFYCDRQACVFGIVE